MGCPARGLEALIVDLVGNRPQVLYALYHEDRLLIRDFAGELLRAELARRCRR